MAATVAQNTEVFVFGGKAHTQFIYQNDQCVVFEEKLEDRASPSHFLVVPRKRLPRLAQASPEQQIIFDHLFQTARRLATERGLAGYHVTVDESHLTDRFLCLHVFGRALHHMLWPVGPGTRL